MVLLTAWRIRSKSRETDRASLTYSGRNMVSAEEAIGVQVVHHGIPRLVVSVLEESGVAWRKRESLPCVDKSCGVILKPGRSHASDTAYRWENIRQTIPRRTFGRQHG